MEIKIGQLGKIVSGTEAGRYIHIVDDAENTGGFLILIALDPELRTGLDDWVENSQVLDQYFKQCDWIIEWL